MIDVLNGIIARMQSNRKAELYQEYRMLCQSLSDYIAKVGGKDLYEDELEALEKAITEEAEWFCNKTKELLNNDDTKLLWKAADYKYVYQIHIQLVRVLEIVKDIGFSSVWVSGEGSKRTSHRKQR